MQGWAGFYKIPDIARLTRIPARTLYGWEALGVIQPTIEFREGERTTRGYSYRDLTLIRLLKALRDDNIDFRSAQIALNHLYDRFGEPSEHWANARVYIVGNKVYADASDEWAVTSASDGGQRVAERMFGDLFTELRGLDKGVSIVVPEEFRDTVSINPNVQGGEPVIRGTRIPTRVILSLRQTGATVREIARQLRTSVAAVRCALRYEQSLSTGAFSS